MYTVYTVRKQIDILLIGQMNKTDGQMNKTYHVKHSINNINTHIHVQYRSKDNVIKHIIA